MDLYQKLFESMVKSNPNVKKQIVQSQTNEIWKKMRNETKKDKYELHNLVMAEIKKNTEKAKQQRNSLSNLFNKMASKEKGTYTLVYIFSKVYI